MRRLVLLASAMVLCAVAEVAAEGVATPAHPPPPPDPLLLGKAVYTRANCVGCHKWHGDGGGGYGGAALSLRHTQLTREQIIETVSCGRPGTGMPYHIRGAYDATPCYGLKRADLPGTMPPEAAAFLRPPEIELVADYVLKQIRGKGEPNYADCIAFFGDGSRVCNIYKTDGPSKTSGASG